MKFKIYPRLDDQNKKLKNKIVNTTITHYTTIYTLFGIINESIYPYTCMDSENNKI